MFRKVISQIKGETYKRKYRIDRKIFSAAFSDVYAATGLVDGRRVALKILNEAGERIARRLDESEESMWEGELLLSLDHPNVVKAYDCGKGKKYWIAMEFYESTLNTYIVRHLRQRDESELLEIFYDIASAISYIHRQGLVHRDIAPDNIMLNDGRAKLIDFGMAIPLGSRVIKGRVGTPSYMAPEMIRRTESTPGGDIYSFGIVMYELVTGIKLFGGRLKEERMTRVLNVQPLSPSALEKSCSAELEELIMRCVSKKAEERPGDAQEVVDMLDIIRKKRQHERE